MPNEILTPTERKLIIDLVQKYFSKCDLIAFGSRVSGHAKLHSDLDIAVKSDQPLDLTAWALLEEDLANSELPFKVDVVDYQRVAAEFQSIIDSTGVTWSAEEV